MRHVEGIAWSFTMAMSAVLAIQLLLMIIADIVGYKAKGGYGGVIVAIIVTVLSLIFATHQTLTRLDEAQKREQAEKQKGPNP